MKAFEAIIFGPGTLGRTWGTRPVTGESLLGRGLRGFEGMNRQQLRV